MRVAPASSWTAIAGDRRSQQLRGLTVAVLYITIWLWDEGALNVTFGALADPTRRAILAKLAKGDASVLELAEPFDMSQPAISKHLKVLERAGADRARPATRSAARAGSTRAA